MSDLHALEMTKQEVARDLAVFRRAHDLVKDRALRSRDDERLPELRLEHWVGTQTVLGTLTMSIHAQERVLEELTIMIQQVVGADDDG